MKTSKRAHKAKAAPQQAIKKPEGNRWRSFRNSRLLRFFLLWVIAWLICLSFFFSEALKPENYLEVFSSWLVFPSVVHALTALLIATAVYVTKRPASFVGKLISVVLLALLLANYDTRLMAVADLFRAVLPLLPKPGEDLPVISALFLLILYALSIAAGVLAEKAIIRHKQLQAQNVLVGLFVLIVFVFGSQALRMAQIMPAIWSEEKALPPSLGKPIQAAAANKPDVYYLVFDRYTSQQVLKEQFAFDNSSFMTTLRDRGFYVNEQAASNYPHTDMSISSTLIADYNNAVTDPFKHKKMQSHVLYHKLAQKSPVIKAMKDAGYTYHNIGSNYGISSRAPQADTDYMYDYLLTVGSAHKRLRGVEVNTFKQSLFFRFSEMPLRWWPITFEEVDHVNYVYKQLRTLQWLAEGEPGGRFIFAHILVPHPPYSFLADGSVSPYPDPANVGKSIREKYTDQVQFINSQLEHTIATIQERTGGNAVILLNADEGPYPDTVYSKANNPLAPDVDYPLDMRHWTPEQLKMKYGILQALYAPKANEQDLADMSSVNAFRIILNRYFGYSLAYRPECHLTLPEGSDYEYVQADLTPLFTGKQDDYCRQLVR